MTEKRSFSPLFYLKLYLAALAVFFAVDMLWLGLVAVDFYHKQLGYILAPSPNWGAAILFYLLYIVALLVFVVLPGLTAGSVGQLARRATFFGFITYATYDLTNLATLKDWPLLLTVADMLWGTCLSAIVSLAAFWVGRRLG